MKRPNDGILWRRWATVGVAAWIAAVLVTGCEQKPPTSATAPAAPPKGEPIRGEPIEAPAPTPALVQEVAKEKAAEGSPGIASTHLGTSAPPVAVTVATSAPPSAVSVATGVGPSGVTPATATNAPAGVVAASAVGKGTVESPVSLAFEKLASFQYALPDGPVDTNTVAQTASTNQIPDNIKSLNNQFVTLKGFMLPLKVEKGLVTELLIMRDQSMCCYGTVPKINEWVSVKMVGTGVKPIMDQAVTLFGKFKVGEMYENGYLVGIYAMDGEKMAGPLDM